MQAHHLQGFDRPHVAQIKEQGKLEAEVIPLRAKLDKAIKAKEEGEFTLYLFCY